MAAPTRGGDVPADVENISNLPHVLRETQECLWVRFECGNSAIFESVSGTTDCGSIVSAHIKKNIK